MSGLQGGRERGLPALDWFRLAAAVLVVCIHTSPLESFAPVGDFWLTRVLGRVAVPFFLMVSGYFLARGGWKGTGRFWRRTAELYLAAVVLYLPVNVYNGALPPLEWGKALFTDGTLYHLWYFPAVLLGVPIVRGLLRLGMLPALGLAGLLYLVGLGGDSYYGLVSQVPALAAVYDGVFLVWEQTRNGLFYAPLFLLLGAAGLRWSALTSGLGFAAALAGMSVEGLWLHAMDYQRWDSMYLLLPVCMVFLFSLLLTLNRGEARAARRVSMVMYVIHPWWIVLLRPAARLTGLEELLLDNSLVHFLAVLALTVLSAWAVYLLRPLRPDPTARAWREVDLDALAHNAQVLQAAAGRRCRLMAVVKADAYGHGAVPVARTLRRRGMKAFAVACVPEGIALRKAGIFSPILVLGWTAPEQAELLRRWRLIQTVADGDHGRALSRQGVPLKVHLAVDTGMHRLGIPVEDTEELEAMFRLPHLHVTGMFTHLCVSDSMEREAEAYTQGQMEAFYAAADRLRQAGLDPGALHAQASYGIWNLPAQPCQWARPGIALYGVYSDLAPVHRRLDLRPVLSLRARVASVRTLRPGEGAGYGLAFTARRETRLAALSIGYADGLPRDLPARGGQVLLRGVRCPMVGRVCMDQLLVDVTGVEGVSPGDPATLIGGDGEDFLPAEEVAVQCGTITNELLSRLSSRLPVVRKGRGI